MNTLSKTLLLLLWLVALLGLAACGGDEPGAERPTSAQASQPAGGAATGVPGGLAELPPGTGELQVRVTDAPPEGVSAIVVTVSNIEVHKAGAREGEGWITLFSATSTTGTTSIPPKRFDLVKVTGIEEVLGTEVFAVGKYTQIRMDVDSVVVTLQVKPGEATTTKEAEIPGDKLKVVRPFDVEEGQTTVLTLDFDAEKAVIVTGTGDVRFKPVVKLLVRKEARGKRDEAGGGGEGGRPEGRGAESGGQGGQGQRGGQQERGRGR